MVRWVGGGAMKTSKPPDWHCQFPVVGSSVRWKGCEDSWSLGGLSFTRVRSGWRGGCTQPR
eukprot:9036227-Alexandrium_andersonii.AAC.1